MKITVLMEDHPASNGLFSEHGLSCLIETKHHQLLMDTGASKKTWENAKALGIDLSTIDTVIISHGHYDHAGGLLSLLEYNPDVEIYMHENCKKDYYHFKNNEEKYIGIDHRIDSLNNIHWINEDVKIDDELTIFTHITGRRRWPKGNLTLHKRIGDQFIQDEFDHEICLVVKEENTVLLSGCAHNGILNILDAYYDKPDVVISGFHMQNSSGYTQEMFQDIKETAYELIDQDTIFYTGHCTGDIPYDLLKEIMKDQLHQLEVGLVLEV